MMTSPPWLLVLLAPLVLVNPRCTEAFVPPRARISSPIQNPSPCKQFQQSAPNRLPPLHGMNDLYSDLSERLPIKTVIESVDELSSRDGKVIASDLSAKAGVSLSQARKDLTTLASLTQGDIAVSLDGELIYSFPRNIQSVLSQNSNKFRLSKIWTKQVWPKLFYGLRVSFGVLLLVSIFAIFSTITLLQSSSSDSDDRRRNDRGGGMGGFGGFGGIWGPSPFDFFYYRPYGYASTPNRDPEKMGFLESTFSYIFGDGNPNEGIEEKRLAMAADMIRRSDGAVSAEQLAPFCDDVPSPAGGMESTIVDESYVLPIVSQLGGEPTVTEEGDIVYVFSELQTSVASVDRYQERNTLKMIGLDADASAGDIKSYMNGMGFRIKGALEKSDLVYMLQEQLKGQTGSPEENDVLVEEEIEFSLATDGNKFLAGGLGVVNLGGALYLGNLLSSYAAYGVRLPSYYGVVQSFYPLLLGYAILFNVIPVIRTFYNKSQNAKINERNRNRRLWRTQVQTMTGSVGRKLQSARMMGMKLKRLGTGEKDTVFNTQMDIEDLQKEKEREMMKKFDESMDEFQ